MSSAIQIIRLLLDATRSGRIRWQKHRTDGDRYEATLGEEVLTVRFVRFVRADRGSPDRHLAELEAFGVTTDHAVGTEGMELINQMLAFCDPNWGALRSRIRQRLSEAEEELQQLLGNPPPKTVAVRQVKPVRMPSRSRSVR